MARNSRTPSGTPRNTRTKLLFQKIQKTPNAPIAPSQRLSKLIVAVDFGTTFSSAAYARVTESMRPTDIGPNDIFCVKDYPGDRMAAFNTFSESRNDVPTELWYPLPGALPHSSTQASIPEARHVQEDNDIMIVDMNDDSDGISIHSDGEENLNAEPEANRMIVDSDPTMQPFWGFEVQQKLQGAEIPGDGLGRIARFKLMLDNHPATQDVRAELAEVLDNLKRLKQIDAYSDTIVDYLRLLFSHTRTELLKVEGYTSNTPVEFVLCVPAVWPSKACRTMQSAISKAASLSGLLNGLGENKRESLFIVSEPEAAAACILEESQEEIHPGDVIIILDAGGGTVDGITYEVTKSQPLRLSKELVTPSTGLCGASYINERLERHLLDRLKNEEYLIKNGKTLRSIVKAKVVEFENGQKRILDVTSRQKGEMTPIFIDDLREDAGKNFGQNWLNMASKDVMMLYEDSLKGTFRVLKEQLDRAEKIGLRVQKVILIGGFGNSPSLQNHLQSKLRRRENAFGGDIELLRPTNPYALSSPNHISFCSEHTDILRSLTAVARGAILRACNKESGPARRVTCSYGFLRTEVWQPQLYMAHSRNRPTIDKVDGERYIYSTIQWLIVKDTLLKPQEERKIPTRHTFKLDERDLICEEELYVSDIAKESHYRKTHPKNKDAEKVGSITVDMSFLRTEGRIRPEKPKKSSTMWGEDVEFWAVEFDLVVKVDGLNLSYEALWPSTVDQSESQRVEQKRLTGGQICIAAAFEPGTK